jgi:hypothetical protein
LEHGPAQVRQDVAVDGASVVGHGDGRDGSDLLAPLQPALDQLANRSRTSVAALAPVDLLWELGLDLLGLAPGRLGLPIDLAAEPPLAAGERVAAGEHLYLETLRRFLITSASAATVIPSAAEE